MPLYVPIAGGGLGQFLARQIFFLLVLGCCSALFRFGRDDTGAFLYLGPPVISALSHRFFFWGGFPY